MPGEQIAWRENLIIVTKTSPANNTKPITKKLLLWFDSNARDLPWRKSRTAYTVWISEVMLQQTQVKQAIPYYINFISQFPDMASLARATQQDVLKIWQGMGYYARARNLHKAATIIVKSHQGKLPQKHTELLNLPGFGPYITSAVLSIAYNKAYAVIDGNVIRVITRLFAIDSDTRLKSTLKIIQKNADLLLDRTHPGKFNEAIMELGATICHPLNPDCGACPIPSECLSRNNDLTAQIPYKSKKAARPIINVSVYIFSYNNKVLLGRRPENGLLGGLWEFPTFRSDKSDMEFHKSWPLAKQKILNGLKQKKTWPVIRHAYTHFQIKLKPYWYEMSQADFKSDFYKELVWMEPDLLSQVPVHKATQKVLTIVGPDLKIIAQ